MLVRPLLPISRGLSADCTVSACSPPPSVCKSSCPLIASGGSLAFGQMSTSSPYPNTELPASKRKQTFLSADLASVLAFEQRAARPHFRAHNLDVCVCLSASQTCPTLCDLMDCSHQAYLSMKFSRQEYWSG